MISAVARIPGKILVRYKYLYTELSESGTVYLDETNPNQTGITKGL